jgi:hypothetical protein
VTTDDPKYETLESLDVSGVKENDEVLTVEFRCECGGFLDTVIVTDDGINPNEMSNICERMCPRCGEYSVFSYLNAYEAKGGIAGTKVPPKTEFSKRKSNQDALRELFAGNLKRPKEEKWSLVRRLLAQAKDNQKEQLNGPGLKIKFRVRRLRQTK